ncbi:MAG: hypothetical protein A2289_21405 [Deltaproteobacteria bacterium RIFOXYA12_FULL_58_15]|nr:MAG: hypothetical protein A2289_21405 [Deltaproteobacteria bacterium RIFOXYA12_FULL_58_15]OGR09723.1 MAG: hypothetical protein A2341_12970 [Deltaproteobacteria bacterium RIFOXYB12_FULL_58_9]
MRYPVMAVLWAITMICGCNSIEQTSSLSECGGFDSTKGALTADGEEEPAYCDAEVLLWEYESGKLSLTNARVSLNCCGEHSISIEEEDEGEYLVSEVDDPESSFLGGGARCSCMCVFDFRIEANDMPERTIHLNLERDVTDSDEGNQSIWQGDIDLTEGNGRIVIDETASFECEPL